MDGCSYMRGSRLPVAFLLLCWVLSFQPGAWADSFRSMPTLTYHAVPCPRSNPDVLAISWRVTRLNSRPHLSEGKRVIRNRVVVRRLYDQICDTTLLKYTQPTQIGCRAAKGDGAYHLVFRRGDNVVLGAKESDQGCQFLWIDGHHNLGFGFGVLYLPPGIPSVLAP